jgi:uncharacterized SAM-binding protein YcdF (DUF218 family)
MSVDFVLSKLLWALTAPATCLFFAVTLGWALQRRMPRTSNLLLGGSAIFLLLLSATPIGRVTLGALEDRFPQQKIDGPIDGIIVLGGALSPDGTSAVGHPQINDAAERLTAFIELARAHPEAKLVFTGGSGEVFRQSVREADDVPMFLNGLGFDASRVTLERDSRNTWENATFSKELVKPRPGEVWVLITSAWHMPRSVGCFRAAGWQVLPYPVDYRTLPRDQWPLLETLTQLDLFTMAAKEWVGLAGYHLMGRTDAWFPAP